MNYRTYPQIRAPEDLGVALLGDPNTAVVPQKCWIDRTKYGRRPDFAEGGAKSSSIF
ncbi:MAG: hypothetical protein LBR74_00640 [Eubacterium sp.]|jgi:hypothetical protein|nr:hypothetical protein [Eubacterium sp.]